MIERSGLARRSQKLGANQKIAAHAASVSEIRSREQTTQHRRKAGALVAVELSPRVSDPISRSDLRQQQAKPVNRAFRPNCEKRTSVFFAAPPASGWMEEMRASLWRVAAPRHAKGETRSAQHTS